MICRQHGIAENTFAPSAHGWRQKFGKLGVTEMQRRLLLILDNFEQLLAGAGLIADLLASAPKLKVLATSREVLRLRAEHQFPLAPLTMPDLHRIPACEQATRQNAVGLFMLRAQQVKPDFLLSSVTDYL